MGRQPKMTFEMSESRIMKASREQFSRFGYHAARIADIVSCSEINRRLVYEIVTDKESLYMAVLSEVSREFDMAVSSAFESQAPTWTSAAQVYDAAFGLLRQFRDFSRLLAWEWLNETIQGARILAVAANFREKIHAAARRVRPECASCLDTLDLALEAMILRYAVADAPSAVDVEHLVQVASDLFSSLENVSFSS